jgi:hypothetical protein
MLVSKEYFHYRLLTTHVIKNQPMKYPAIQNFINGSLES